VVYYDDNGFRVSGQYQPDIKAWLCVHNTVLRNSSISAPQAPDQQRTMRANIDTVLVGEKVVLVPYKPEHVPVRL